MINHKLNAVTELRREKMEMDYHSLHCHYFNFAISPFHQSDKIHQDNI